MHDETIVPQAKADEEAAVPPPKPGQSIHPSTPAQPVAAAKAKPTMAPPAAPSVSPAGNAPAAAPKSHVAKLPPVLHPAEDAAKNPAVAKTTDQMAIAKAAEELANEEESDEVEEGTENSARGAIAGVIKTIFSWVVMPVLIVFFLHSFVFQAFYVSGSSMNPDFQDGDYLIIDKFNFTLSSIKGMVGMDTSLDLKRGDVLVFRYPNSPSTFFIKRLIGLPGDRVVVKDGKVTIYDTEHPNGLTLKEPYIDPAETTQGDIDEVVDQGKYFVMGDNRSPNGSFDSREWGQLPRYDIVGVASARLLPINELGPIKHPSY